MSMIESRPLRKRNWEYIFFIDLAGHKEDAPVRNALEKLESMCMFFKILGSYPRAMQQE